jgi:hypothetical protein
MKDLNSIHTPYYPIPSDNMEDDGPKVSTMEMSSSHSPSSSLQQWLVVYPYRFVLLLTMLISLFLMSYTYLNSDPILLSNGGQIVHIKLSNKQYLATKSNGEVIMTKVAWIHGGRFELFKISESNYQIKSLITKKYLQVNLKSMKLEATQDLATESSIWNMFSSSASSTTFLPFTLFPSTPPSSTSKASRSQRTDRSVSQLQLQDRVMSSTAASVTYTANYELQIPEEDAINDMKDYSSINVAIPSSSSSSSSFSLSSSSAIHHNKAGNLIPTSRSSASTSSRSLSSSLVTAVSELTLELLGAPIKGVNVGGWLIPERWMYPGK